VLVLEGERRITCQASAGSGKEPLGSGRSGLKCVLVWTGHAWGRMGSVGNMPERMATYLPMFLCGRAGHFAQLFFREVVVFHYRVELLRVIDHVALVMTLQAVERAM
jgi:hypothetical protein